MNILKALLLAPTLVFQIKALYDTIDAVDEDPTIKAAFQEFRHNPVINATWESIRAQAKSIVATAKQIKDIF